MHNYNNIVTFVTMQIKQYVKNVAKAILQPFGKSYPAYAAGLSMIGGRFFSWGTDGMSAYGNKVFYAATNILVRKLTEAPITFSRRKTSASKFDKFYSKSITNEKRVILKAVSLTELEDHELNKMFDNPNTYTGGIEMMEDFWHNYGFGDGFLFFEPIGELSRNKLPYHAHSLNRNRVQVIQSTDSYDQVSHYVYTTWNGRQIRIEKENMLHLKHWNPNIGDLKGLGVDVIAGMDINLNRQNNIAQGSAFVNGGRGTLFASDSHINSDGEVVEKYTAEQMTVLRQTMERDMQGAQNNRRMYYANGLVNAQNYGDTLAEMELITAENANWKSIFAIVGVPVALAPITEAATENNVKAGYKALVTNLVISELRKFDQKLTQKIQQWWPDIIACHDLTEFTELAADLELMQKVYGTVFATVDENRAVFGHDQIGGDAGKTILVNSGLMPLDSLLGTFETDPNAEAL